MNFIVFTLCLFNLYKGAPIRLKVLCFSSISYVGSTYTHTNIHTYICVLSYKNIRPETLEWNC